MLEWLDQSKQINGEEIEEGTVEVIDPLLVNNVLEVMKRMNRPDLALLIFKAYLDTVPSKEVGFNDIWARMIRILGSGPQGDVLAADALFRRWRDRYQVSYSPSSSHNSDTVPSHPHYKPYIAMLDVFAHTHSTSTKQFRTRNDPCRLFLPLLASDRVELSTSIFNSLLRLELSRRSYTSFWGLWSKMELGNWERNSSTWKLGIKAKVWQDGILGRRKGMYDNQSGLPQGRSTGLQLLAGYEPSVGPTARELFKIFLRDSLKKSNHRPSVRIPNYENPIMSTSILNSFLELFINLGDWKLAVIVLENFGVYKIEPDEKTHGIVVVGVIQSWEKGLLETNNLSITDSREECNEMRDGRGGGGGRGRSIRRQEEALEMISGILQERKMRIALWTDSKGQRRQESLQLEESEEGEEEEEEEEEEGGRGGKYGVKEFKDFKIPTTPAWMLRREMRDIVYLRNLLKRCGRLDSVRWSEALTKARKEVLPIKMIKEEKKEEEKEKS